MKSSRRLAGEARGSRELLAQLQRLARPLRGPEDLDPLMDLIGDARFVLLGEASHGTADYYTWRAEISQRLIQERGFSFLAVEGDWPDCYRINRYVKGLPDAGDSARDVLSRFRRWPTWLWANEEVLRLLDWLRRHNEGLGTDQQAGFYGLDVYSLWDSLYAVLQYLQKADPSALPTARKAFRCFEPYGEDEQEYARATMLVPQSCAQEVVDLLHALRRRGPEHQADGRDTHFTAEQNALVLKNAEAYYRAMVRGGPESWNVRDRHMAETLDRLMDHHGPQAKAIVWEHNTHIGDARFTDMTDDGMVNLGQLARARHADEGVVLVGFGSYKGSVIAGRAWDAPPEKMRVPPAREGSWEQILHELSAENKLLLLTQAGDTHELVQPRGQRAIGVVYHPEYEYLGNYVPTVLPRRYDAFLYLDVSEALHPLPVAAHAEGEVPETYPSGV